MEPYERIRELAHGSFGVAVLMRRKQPGDGDKSGLLVVKEIDLALMPRRERQEARNEVDVLRSLSHVNVIAYIDTFLEADRLCIAMEFADAGDLASELSRRKATGRPIVDDDAMAIFQQCCSGLRHTHANHVVHRDLKCQNIFLTSQGVVKIGDYGIAKSLDHTTMKVQSKVGTPFYTAPEVCDSAEYDLKADIWSLGVVLYEVLALELPFQGASLVSLVMKIIGAEPKPLPDSRSQELRCLVALTLQKKPDRRPSCDELLARPAVRAADGSLFAVEHREPTSHPQAPQTPSTLLPAWAHKAGVVCGSPHPSTIGALLAAQTELASPSQTMTLLAGAVDHAQLPPVFVTLAETVGSPRGCRRHQLRGDPYEGFYRTPPIDQDRSPLDCTVDELLMNLLDEVPPTLATPRAAAGATSEQWVAAERAHAEQKLQEIELHRQALECELLGLPGRRPRPLSAVSPRCAEDRISFSLAVLDDAQDRPTPWRRPCIRRMRRSQFDSPVVVENARKEADGAVLLTCGPDSLGCATSTEEGTPGVSPRFTSDEEFLPAVESAPTSVKGGVPYGIVRPLFGRLPTRTPSLVERLECANFMLDPVAGSHRVPPLVARSRSNSKSYPSPRQPQCSMGSVASEESPRPPATGSSCGAPAPIWAPETMADRARRRSRSEAQLPQPRQCFVAATVAATGLPPAPQLERLHVPAPCMAKRASAAELRERRQAAPAPRVVHLPEASGSYRRRAKGTGPASGVACLPSLKLRS